METHFIQVQYRIFIYVNLIWVLTFALNWTIWNTIDDQFLRIPVMVASSFLMHKRFTKLLNNLLTNFITTMTTTLKQLELVEEDSTKYDSRLKKNIKLVYQTTELLLKEKTYIVITSLLFGYFISLSSLWLCGDYDQLFKQQALFLISEFMLVCFYHFEDLCWNSFQINHSNAYSIALLASQIEFWLEFILFRDPFKINYYVVFIGLIFSTLGHLFRIGAFLNAKSNFHHLVQRSHAENHILVTTGVYSICRHPSYLGFFIQALGGQLILTNPFCFLAYTVVLWRFFYDRIYEEEYYLEKFFGDSYVKYKQKTSTLIPWIDSQLIKRQKSKQD